MDKITKKSGKKCFGILDRVFPVGESGLREVVDDCFVCDDRVECLQEALATPEGLDFRSDLLEERHGGGFVGLIKRWSEKKTLSRLKEREKK